MRKRRATPGLIEAAVGMAAASTHNFSPSTLRLELDSLKVLLGAGQHDPSSRHASSSFTCSLIRKYLCRPSSSGDADQRVAVLNVVSGLASKLPAAFNFGDPHYIGSIILALLENLAALEDEHDQPELIETLRTSLLLLRTGDGRAFACLGRELMEVLTRLAELTAKLTERMSFVLVSLSAFDGFARMCGQNACSRARDDASSKSRSSAAGVTLRLRSPSHLAVLQVGLAQLAAGMHVVAPAFLGDEGPVLWAALQLVRPPGPAERSVSWFPQLLISTPMKALTQLLHCHGVPASLHSRLLPRLLASLCGCCAPSGKCRHGQVTDLAEVVGDCLEKLCAPPLPPLPPLRLLTRATVSALDDGVRGYGARLRASLVQLWRALPSRILSQHLAYFDPYLGSQSAHGMLLLMLSRALLDDGEDGDELEASGDDAECGEGLPTAKRRRLVGEPHAIQGALRRRLVELTLLLALPSAPAVNANAVEDACKLRWTANRMCALSLMLKVLGGGDRGRDGERGRGISSRFSQLPQPALTVSDFPPQIWRALVEVFDEIVRYHELGTPALMALDIVIDLCGRDAAGESIPREVTLAALRLATLPWSSRSGVAMEGLGRTTDTAAGRPSGWGRSARGLSALPCRAIQVLMRLPKAEGMMAERLRVLERVLSREGHGVEQGTAAVEGSAAAEAEERVLIVALNALPRLMTMHGLGKLRVCVETLHDLCTLSSNGEFPGLAGPLGKVIGRLACLQGGRCHRVCDINLVRLVASRGSHDRRAATFAYERAPAHDREVIPHCYLCDGTHNDERTALETTGCGDAVAEESIDRLQVFLPHVWTLLTRLPAVDCSSPALTSRWRARAELVHSLARLARHASTAELARMREVLRQLVGLLADHAKEVSAACAEVLPRLLGWEAFVRVVGGLPEPRPLDARSLTKQVIAPMVQMMRDPSKTELVLPMMRTLGALGREPLYATKPACLAAIVLTLSRHLAADELSLEFDIAMQQLRAIGESACEPSGAAAGAAAFDPPLERICRQLAPQLHIEWVWWAHERPKLLSAVAQRLLECSERELLERAVSHALPNIVLLGGLSQVQNEDAAFELASTDASCPLVPTDLTIGARARARGRSAAALLQLLAQRLERSAPTLLVEHMHLILPELFVRQASDELGELGAAIPGGLEFLFAMGINRANSPTDMVRMSAGGLLQEMVLRLGRAADTGATRSVLLALNLLIPIGLQVGGDECYTSASPDNSLMKSCALSRSNAQLRAYVDANFHLIMQFLRDRVRAPALAICEKTVALNALQQVLAIMEGAEISHSWWGELVTTLKLALQQERLQEQALRVLRQFVTLLGPDMRARGLQQLFLMPLHCLNKHPAEVVAVLEALLVPACKDGVDSGGAHGRSGAVAEAVVEAMGELSFLSNHPALVSVKQALEEHQQLRVHLCTDEPMSQLSACARGIAHESSAVRLMALSQLRKTLHELQNLDLAGIFAPSARSGARSRETLGVTSETLRQLLACCQLGAASISLTSAHDELACAAELAMQCLGEIGALDPARVALALTARAATGVGLGASAAGWSSAQASDAELSIWLIEDFLLKALRDAAKGQVVQSIAYTITVLLQRVCRCTAETPALLHIYEDMEAERAGHGSRDGRAAAAWRALDDEQCKALELWGGLSESARRTVHPYLTLYATVSHERRAARSCGEQLCTPAMAAASVFTPGIRYSDWLVGWARQLQQELVRLCKLPCAEAPPQHTLDRAELLLACEPCLRFDPHLAQQLLPHIIEQLLLHGGPALQEAMRCELHGVLTHAPAQGTAAAEHQLCCQAVFSVLDTLKIWHVQCRQAVVLRQCKSGKYGERSNESARVVALTAFLRSLPELELARAALRCGAHCRALRSLEAVADQDDPINHRHFVRPGNISRQLGDEAGALMHRAYTQTGEPDGLLGLSLIREQISLEEEALELELIGRYGAALCCYQLALQRPPSAAVSAPGALEQMAVWGWARRPAHSAKAFPTGATVDANLDSQLGLCRSLRCLGLFAQLKDAAESALRAATSETARYALTSHALQGAWRLGAWDDVERLIGTCPIRGPVDVATSASAAIERASESCEFVYELELARALLALHRGEPAAIDEHCRRARQAILPLLAAASMDSYNHAYPCLAKLQSLQELQTSASLLTGTDPARRVTICDQQLIFDALGVPSAQMERAHSAAMPLWRSPLSGGKCVALFELLKKWQVRIEHMTNSPHELEPVVAVRCCVLRELQSTALRQCGGNGDIERGLGDVALRGLSKNWLHFAKSARAAGNTETASHAVMQAGLYERSGAVMLSTKMDWEAGRTHQAIARLTQQRSALLAVGASNTNSVAGGALLNAGTAAHFGHLEEYSFQRSLMETSLQLARFSEQAGECEGAELLEMHSSVVDPDKGGNVNWAKGHFWLGYLRDRQLGLALEGAAQDMEVVPPGGQASAPRKVPVAETVKGQKRLKVYEEHLASVLQAYGRALKHGPKYAPRSLPRLLTLWFDFSDLHAQMFPSHVGSKVKDEYRSPHAQMERLVNSSTDRLPCALWLPSVAQLVSRVCLKNGRARGLVHDLLAKLLAEFPRQLVWSVIPCAMSEVTERRRFGETIVAKAKHQLMGWRGAEVDSLTKATKLIEHLKRLANDAAINKHEKRVSMKARWGELSKLVSLPVVVPVYDHLTAADPRMHISGSVHAPFARDAPAIESFEDEVEVMSSLRRPKKLAIRGSDGRTYVFLCKPKDDLRKDARVMDFMTCINRQLRKSAQCRRRRLAVRCYAVTPLNSECGMIEWVPNMVQLRSIIKEYWDLHGIPFSHTDIKRRFEITQKEQARTEKLVALCKTLMDELPPMLHHWLLDCFQDPSMWFEARLAFSRSCAVMSMIGFTLGLGDRHLENILINNESGSLMHVDFACLFDHGKNLMTPEQVPFRLTQNLLHSMGVCAADGFFRRVSELSLEQVRNHKHTLLNVLSTMRHDPLVDWIKRNDREDASGMRDSEEAEKELNKIDLKLRGILQEHGPNVLSVQGQVQQLISDATNINNLARMYIWWMPWC